MKKYLLASCAVILAVGFSAFTSPKSVKAPKYWFSATNSTTSLTSVALQFPASAPTATETTPFNCPGSINYCSLAFNNIVFDAGTNTYKPSNDGVNILTPSQYDDAGILQGSARKNN